VTISLGIQLLLERQDQAEAALVEGIDPVSAVLEHSQLLVQFRDTLLDLDVLCDAPIDDKDCQSLLKLRVTEFEKVDSVSVISDLLNCRPL